MNAEEIKKAILEEKAKPPKPVEAASIYGHEGWLFKPSSCAMEGWRILSNALTPDGKPDEGKRKLAAAYLVLISFRDKEGKPVFEELELPIIAGIPDDEINPIRLAVLRINGMNLEGFEDIAKNLIAVIGIGGVYDLLASIGAPCPNCTKGTQPTSLESSGPASDTGRLAGRPWPLKRSSSEK